MEFGEKAAAEERKLIGLKESKEPYQSIKKRELTIVPTVKTDKGHETNPHYLEYTTFLLEKKGKREEILLV